jgi:hypothetical protein
MTRRDFFAAMSAAGAMAPLGTATKAPDIAAAAREAWIYGLPLIEVANIRFNVASGRASQGQNIGVNHLMHNRRLATANSRSVTAPNVDTLYSGAFIDLLGGPATITLPATGKRYISLQLMDMYTNSFCILGTRTTGPDGGTFTIVGPTQAADPGAIRAPTPWIWALVRLLVDGPDDYAEANRIQDGINLLTGSGRKPGSFATRDAVWHAYFESVQRLLAENPPPATDTAFFHRVAALGLGPQGGFDRNRFSAAQITAIESGVKEAADAVRAINFSAHPDNGWTYPLSDLGVWEQDYSTRAMVALGGLAALPLVEAMYCSPWSPDGKHLFTDNRLYKLSFPRGKLPPAYAFWSLTMYERTPSGQSFLVDNRLNRYAIGDRTRELIYNDDGSLNIWIGREDPGGTRASNWLPAPKSGPYKLSMRCYLPKRELLNGGYKFPPVEAV